MNINLTRVYAAMACLILASVPMSAHHSFAA
jgi:hypothetical protein